MELDSVPIYLDNIICLDPAPTHNVKSIWDMKGWLHEHGPNLSP